MSPADYDQYLPELLTLARRVADDLGRIEDIEAASIEHAAAWLRTELPRLAATVVGTDGVDIDGDMAESDDPRWIYIPAAIYSVLGQPIKAGDDYGDTPGRALLQAWTAFVGRYPDGDQDTLRGALETGAQCLDGTSDDVSPLPDAGQKAALKALRDADYARSSAARVLAEAELAAADRVRDCIAANVPVVKIAAELGVTRARIYQIRDGRR